MALQETISNTLKTIEPATDPARLREAYAAITYNLNNQSTFRAGVEALVICAETALKVRAYLGGGDVCVLVCVWGVCVRVCGGGWKCECGREGVYVRLGCVVPFSVHCLFCSITIYFVPLIFVPLLYCSIFPNFFHSIGPLIYHPLFSIH